MALKRRLVMFALLMSALVATSKANKLTEKYQGLSLTQLEKLLNHIDNSLERLARHSLRSGIGPVGYRTQTHETGHITEWIRIDLAEESAIDQIALVPSIWRDTEKGFVDDGFPVEFSIIIGHQQDPKGSVLARFGPQDYILPRIAPLIIPCSGNTASWVKVEATTLSARAWDGKYILQLDEILVFKGQKNLALRRPIEASSPDGPSGYARRLHYLVDGFLPYIMNSARGEQSIAFVSRFETGNQPSLTLDLEAIHPLDRIQFHAIELDDTVPMSTPSGFGIPKRMHIEGATKPDFSDAIALVECNMPSVFDTGPIIIRHFPETPCRYVRIMADEPFTYAERGIVRSSLGFAEIELFANGENVAQNKEFSVNLAETWVDRRLSSLTDGRNLYGEILPIRDWINELAYRHDLETERPLVVAELNRRYARQKVNLTIMQWVTAFLAMSVIFIILIDRILRMRQVARIKERFAADLHDELGANLHTIGLLSDLAEQSSDNPDELSMLHERIRAVTERTGTAVRYCTSIQEANGLYTGLITDMERAAMRIMAKLEHNITIEGEEHLEKLKPRTRVDLFLFYKECLVNISRHSGATEFSTELKATPKDIHLIVSDNGRGLTDSKVKGIPSSLKRRARLLGAKVTVESPETGGTRIVLKLRTQRWGIPR